MKAFIETQLKESNSKIFAMWNDVEQDLNTNMPDMDYKTMKSISEKLYELSTLYWMSGMIMRELEER